MGARGAWDWSRRLDEPNSPLAKLEAERAAKRAVERINKVDASQQLGPKAPVALTLGPKVAPRPIDDDEPVHFEGEWVWFGDLTVADRHMVHRDADGVLRGSYPF